MSLRTAREWETGPAPSATKQPRDWRTRPDPFAAVWLTDVEPLLRRDVKGVLEAKLVLEVLRTRYPEQFHPGQARTLQRRFRDWRARHGVEPEVFFQQVAVPGREAAIDFTHATDLGVTIAGVPFPHLLFEFVLSSATGPGCRSRSARRLKPSSPACRARCGRLVGCRRSCGATICRPRPTS